MITLISLALLAMAAQDAADDPCAGTPCRDAAVLEWELPEGDTFQLEIGAGPYSVGPMGTVLIPGEAVRLRLTGEGPVLDAEVIYGGPRQPNPEIDARQAEIAGDMNAWAETVTDAEIDETWHPSSQPESFMRDETLGDDEIRIEAYVQEVDGELQSFFVIQSGLSEAVTFQMFVATPNSGDEFRWVSSCNLVSRLISMEHFPYLIYNAAFVNFRTIEADDVMCGYWDLETDHPIDPGPSGEN